MQPFIDFVTTNKDALPIILGVISAVLVAIWGAWKLLIERWWKQHQRIEIKVFDVITDPAKLLPRLFNSENDDSPLADHNILYQPRAKDKDIQGELRAALNKKRYLLVTAPTGYGKTREAGMLAKSLMSEGYRIVLVRTGWLEKPKELPPEFNGNRSRIVLFCDDLNGLFRAGDYMQSPRAEQMPILSQPSYHDRLLEMLEAFETMFGPNEIRVIATARSEAEEWKKLAFNENDRLWKNFERFELPAPQIESLVDVLESETKTTAIRAREADFPAIARKNDGTYRNVILNLRRVKNEGDELREATYRETLDGSWREIYQRDLNKYPAIEHIYAAMLILRQARVELLTIMVEPIAEMLAGGNRWQKILIRRNIRRALHYLTNESKVLPLSGIKIEPHDGQIEACGSTKGWMDFAGAIEGKLLALSQHNPNDLADSLFGLSISFYNAQKTGNSLRVLQRYIELNPSEAGAYNNLGVLLKDLKCYDEVEAAYRKAIELSEASPAGDSPPNTLAYYNLGILLKDLKRYDEAEAAWRTAIELDPSDARAYSNLGVLLDDLKRYDEAEATHRTAIELSEASPTGGNPSEALAYYNLGVVLHNLKRYDEAEAAYHKAIELSETSPAGDNTSEARAYSNLGVLLNDLKRYDEAEAAYRKAIELSEASPTGDNPSEVRAYNNLGILLHNLKHYDEAEAAYCKAIELSEASPTGDNPSEAHAYNNLGVLLKNLKRYDEAETVWLKAIELSEAPPTGDNPPYARVYQNLIILLRLRKRDADAFPFLEKLVSLTPDDFNPYLALASIKKVLGQGLLPEYIDKARQLMPEDDWCNRACLESVVGNMDEAFEHLAKAIQENDSNKAWAWEDPDLQWLREDARFVEIVGLKPEE
jgi:tetratricopeptide (TPR) repeat protein